MQAHVSQRLVHKSERCRPSDLAREATAERVGVHIQVAKRCQLPEFDWERTGEPISAEVPVGCDVPGTRGCAMRNNTK